MKEVDVLEEFYRRVDIFKNDGRFFTEFRYSNNFEKYINGISICKNKYNEKDLIIFIEDLTKYEKNGILYHIDDGICNYYMLTATDNPMALLKEKKQRSSKLSI